MAVPYSIAEHIWKELFVADHSARLVFEYIKLFVLIVPADGDILALCS
jgi:hypothetical protein